MESRRDGRQLYYRLTDPEIHEACAIMRSILYRRLKQGEKLASAIHSAAAPSKGALGNSLRVNYGKTNITGNSGPSSLYGFC